MPYHLQLLVETGLEAWLRIPNFVCPNILIHYVFPSYRNYDIASSLSLEPVLVFTNTLGVMALRISRTIWWRCFDKFQEFFCTFNENGSRFIFPYKSCFCLTNDNNNTG